MKARATVLLALLGSAVAGPALAYGPGTHVLEARHYIERLAAGDFGEAAAGDLAILQDPEWQPFFEVGAIFPDIGRRVASMGFDAHRLDLHDALLAATASREEPALRAFVLGAAQHSMSDAAAQVFYVPWLTAATDIGVVDVLVGYSDGPGGENEFFLEAFCDLYEGDLHRVVDLYFAASPSGPLALGPVLERYYAAAEAVLGDQPLTPETFSQSVLAFLSEVGAIIEVLGADAVHRIVEDAMSGPASEIFDFLAGAGADLLGVEEIDLGPDTVDPLARAQLEVHPFVADRALYAESYGGWFAKLGPAFLGDTFASNAIIDGWRTWQGPPLLAAGLQSLAWTLPESFEPLAGVHVWSLGFETEAGSVASLDATVLPDEVSLSAWLFPSTDESFEVTVEVFADRPGLTPGVQVASADVAVAGLPAGGGPPHRVEARVSFDPADWTDEATGFYAVIRETDAERPFLSTSVEDYLATEGADLTLPVWASVFAVRSGWQPVLPMVDGGATNTDVWVDVRVRNARYPRQAITGVVVTVEDEEGALGSVTTSGVGRALWGPAEAGTYRAVPSVVPGFAPAEPTAWLSAAGGEVAVATLALDPIPVIVHSGFTTNRGRARGQIDDSRYPFLDSQSFSVARSASEAVPVAGWREQVGGIIEFELVPPGEDGQSVYLFARAAPEGETAGGPIGVSDALVVDGSPAASVALAAPPVWPLDAPALNGTLTAVDPHSGVVSFVVRVEDADGLVLDEVTIPATSPAALHLERRAALEAAGQLRLVPIAINGAGLAGEGEASTVRFAEAPAAEPGLEPAESGRDVGAADVSDGSDAGEVDLGREPGAGDGCGCGAARRGASDGWWMVLIGLVVVGRWRRSAGRWAPRWR